MICIRSRVFFKIITRGYFHTKTPINTHNLGGSSRNRSAPTPYILGRPTTENPPTRGDPDHAATDRQGHCEVPTSTQRNRRRRKLLLQFLIVRFQTRVGYQEDHRIGRGEPVEDVRANPRRRYGDDRSRNDDDANDDQQVSVTVFFLLLVSHSVFSFPIFRRPYRPRPPHVCGRTVARRPNIPVRYTPRPRRPNTARRPIRYYPGRRIRRTGR